MINLAVDYRIEPAVRICKGAKTGGSAAAGADIRNVYAGYTGLLGELKNRVRAAPTQAIRTVNTKLIALLKLA